MGTSDDLLVDGAEPTCHKSLVAADLACNWRRSG